MDILNTRYCSALDLLATVIIGTAINATWTIARGMSFVTYALTQRHYSRK